MERISHTPIAPPFPSSTFPLSSLFNSGEPSHCRTSRPWPHPSPAAPPSPPPPPTASPATHHLHSLRGLPCLCLLVTSSLARPPVPPATLPATTLHVTGQQAASLLQSSFPSGTALQCSPSTARTSHTSNKRVVVVQPMYSLRPTTCYTLTTQLTLVPPSQPVFSGTVPPPF